MKVFTSILPRLDGTVVARVGDTAYVFKADEEGSLACDVQQEHAVELLKTGSFSTAVPLSAAIFPTTQAKDTDDDAGAGGDDGDDEGDENGPLIEESAFPVSNPIATSARPRGRPPKPKAIIQ